VQVLYQKKKERKKETQQKTAKHKIRIVEGTSSTFFSLHCSLARIVFSSFCYAGIFF